MARSYKFSLIQISSSEARGERLNVGVAILNERGLDVRVSRRLEKVRAISAALDPVELRDAIERLGALDRRLLDAGIEDPAARLSKIGESSVTGFTSFGEFVANSPEDYERCIGSLLQHLVDPEPAPHRRREKRSRLLTQVRTRLKAQGVLAARGEDIASHRVVQNVQLENGLVADFALKNGAMHVIETVDATGGEESFRRAVSEIGVAALVLETARIKFGKTGTKTKLVYSASTELERASLPSLKAAEHQGNTLINWASDLERTAFLESLAALATPLPEKTEKRASRALPDDNLI